ncbi:MAG TPA: diacylglycerol kinase family protein [Actinomycetota bacterium]|nr:diacylglycerol kinase family protein [Actinomycetota bacterium]
MIAADTRPSGVLIVNPGAGSASDARRLEIVAQVRRRCRVDVVETPARDAGIEVAAGAADAGVAAVIAFGGDGLVNEAANGVAGTATSLAILPGGTMNVFARALGIPADPHDAIEALVARWHAGPRNVPLGRMDDRYFTFSAGCGFDAEAADLVERDLRSKRRFGELFFYWSAARVLATTYRRRRPSMTLTGDFGEVPVAMAIACNAGPYAYFAGRPVNLAPDVSLEGGLDVFALKSMRIEALPLYAWRAVVSGDLVHHRDTFYATDLGSFEIAADHPFARHVDGEPLPPASSARFEIVADVLKVVGAAP